MKYDKFGVCLKKIIFMRWEFLNMLLCIINGSLKIFGKVKKFKNI